MSDFTEWADEAETLPDGVLAAPPTPETTAPQNPTTEDGASEKTAPEIDEEDQA